ncbi:NUDIX domain-containing protein, partial [Streptomyces sp. SP17BM10]|uniref:NUDIX domain-containing protein n=1 Tax=Streptomyces sp. SP17BM10 TaxID=3002530 RepID=UPI002E766379
GGKPEPGETHEQALVREIAREHGVTQDAAEHPGMLLVEAPACKVPANAAPPPPHD